MQFNLCWDSQLSYVINIKHMDFLLLLKKSELEKWSNKDTFDSRYADIGIGIQKFIVTAACAKKRQNYSINGNLSLVDSEQTIGLSSDNNNYTKVTNTRQ